MIDLIRIEMEETQIVLRLELARELPLLLGGSGATTTGDAEPDLEWNRSDAQSRRAAPGVADKHAGSRRRWSLG